MAKEMPLVVTFRADKFMTEKYIHDNPFRLLSIGSGTTYSALKIAANKTDKERKVGIECAAGLENVFGSEEGQYCVDKVRALGTSPLERTLYRIFWFLDYRESWAGNRDLASLKRAGIETLNLPCYCSDQYRFLLHWYIFLTEASVPEALSALNAFADFYSDEAAADCLINLLNQEGEDDASGIVERAFEQATIHLYSALVSQAGQWWNQSQISEAIGLIEELKSASWNDETLTRAFRHLLPLGNREEDRVKQLLNNDQAYRFGDKYNPIEVEKLRMLSEALLDYVPSAQLWKETVIKRIDQVALSMNKFAVDLANEKKEYQKAREILIAAQGLPVSSENSKLLQENLQNITDSLAETIRSRAVDLANKNDDYDQAHELLTTAYRLPISSELIKRIREDLQQIAKLIDQRDTFQGIAPIEDTPSLSTVNGVGGILYGKEKFPHRSSWYFKTYFFCIVGLPFFPICRYLVSDAHEGGWYFHGKSGLKKSDWVYGLFTPVLIAILIGVTRIFDSSPHHTPPSFDYSSSYSSSGMGVAPNYGTSPSALAKDQQEILRAKREKEISQLSSEYDRLKAKNNKEAARIDAKRAELDRLHDLLKAERDAIALGDFEGTSVINGRIDAYEQMRKRFNRTVSAHNTQIKRMKRIVNKIRALEKEE